MDKYVPPKYLVQFPEDFKPVSGHKGVVLQTLNIFYNRVDTKKSSVVQ
jgi:hypothetical protein